MAEHCTGRQFRLFSLSSNVEIAQKIVNTIGVPLGKVSTRKFSDGGIMINIEETVRGDDIYIIQSTSYPVSDNLWKLPIMVNVCRRASASTVNVVIPYFGYSRQDRIAASREPITARLVTDMLVKTGVDHLLTLDLHAVRVQEFSDVLVDNLFTVPFFTKYYCELELKGEDVVVVSPENSGIKHTRSLAQYFDPPIATIDCAENDPHREGGHIIGEVASKKAIFVDDILNTGKTFAEAAEVVEHDGATEICAVASHGLFVGGATESLDTAPIEEILVTDSVVTKERLPRNIKYLSANKLVTDAIIRIHEKSPPSPLLSCNTTKN